MFRPRTWGGQTADSLAVSHVRSGDPQPLLDLTANLYLYSDGTPAVSQRLLLND